MDFAYIFKHYILVRKVADNVKFQIGNNFIILIVAYLDITLLTWYAWSIKKKTKPRACNLWTSKQFF